MTKIVITIVTENAAFESEPLVETAIILRKLAAQMDRTTEPDALSPSLSDSNGNKVGTVEVWD